MESELSSYIIQGAFVRSIYKKHFYSLLFKVCTLLIWCSPVSPCCRMGKWTENLQESQMFSRQVGNGPNLLIVL
jgi:hypothetical protein